MRRLLAALAPGVVLVAVTGASVQAQAAAPRFEVLGHVDPGIVYAADVFAHAGHAYLSSHRGRDTCRAAGVLVYDLRDPRRPRLVSRFGRVRGTWTEKTIVRRVRTASFSGDLAATSFQACSPGAFQGFGVYDVTNPRRPRKLALVRTQPRGSHELWLAAARGRAYVYTAITLSELRTARDAETPGRPDFRIFDVSAPRRPRELGGWGAWRELGIHPLAGRGSLLSDARANLVHSVTGNRTATRADLSYWDLGTVVLDVADPRRPRYLGRTPQNTDDAGNAHSAALAFGERVLVETHEAEGGRPTLFDVSDPRGPARLSDFALPAAVLRAGRRAGSLDRIGNMDLTDSVHDAKVAGQVAYFSWYGQGVVAADVSDVRRPRFLARFLPPPARDRERLACPGRRCVVVLGVAVGAGYVLASDAISGLWVLRLRR